MKMSNRLAAEFVGTFWLVLGGCGSAVLAAAFPGVGIGLLGVAFAFGLTVLTNDTRQADRKSISRQTIEDAAGAV